MKKPTISKNLLAVYVVLAIFASVLVLTIPSATASTLVDMTTDHSGQFRKPPSTVPSGKRYL